MMQNMDQACKKSKALIDAANIKEHALCIGFDKATLKYYRLQIKKIVKERGVEDTFYCLYLDEGRSAYFQATNLFSISEQFLQLKFQVNSIQ